MKTSILLVNNNLKTVIMLNKIFLLMGILTFTGANSQIRESYEPNFLKFSLSDFGFKGKVKTITTAFLKKNENGEFVASAWKTAKLHHNFDEQGKLISEYGISHNMDTVEVTMYSYNENNQISKVNKYSKGIFDENSVAYYTVWEKFSAKFEYDETENIIRKETQQYNIFENTIFEYNSGKQLVKSVRLDNTSETNSSLDKTEYFYNVKGYLIKIINKDEHNPQESGETIYTYDNGELVSEIFTRFDGAPGKSTFKNKRKVNSYSGTDTLTNYNKSIYNEKGELIKSFHHYDGDGVFQSHNTYSYIYDDHKNLIEEKTIHFAEIRHSREVNEEEIYKIIYEITYY